MKTDALSDLIRTVGDDSPAEHKAIFHLWSALDDIIDGRLGGTPNQIARRGLTNAANTLGGGR